MCGECTYMQSIIGNDTYGECRKRAPAPKLGELDSAHDCDAEWPVVHAVDWCGEFVDREAGR